MKKTLRQRVGFNIRYICWQKDYTQTKLSEISGLPLSYICKVVNGKINVTINTLEKIANALEVDVRELFNEG